MALAAISAASAIAGRADRTDHAAPNCAAARMSSASPAGRRSKPQALTCVSSVPASPMRIPPATGINAKNIPLVQRALLVCHLRLRDGEIPAQCQWSCDGLRGPAIFGFVIGLLLVLV